MGSETAELQQGSLEYSLLKTLSVAAGAPEPHCSKAAGAVSQGPNPPLYPRALGFQ